MPSSIGKCELFSIKHTILLEGEIFLRNKHKVAFFFLNKMHIFLVENKTPLRKSTEIRVKADCLIEF